MEPDWARPVVHWEIEAVDPERIAGFYRELFNWEIGAGKVKGIAPGRGAPEPQVDLLPRAVRDLRDPAGDAEPDVRAAAGRGVVVVAAGEVRVAADRRELR